MVDDLHYPGCTAGEALMWKITTRGFTLQELLIMAAMNVLDNDRQKRGKRSGATRPQRFIRTQDRNTSELKP